MSDHLRIVELYAENVKRLRAVHVVPGDDPVVIIGGNNGQGKSSLLDSIMWALAGKRTEDAVPIRRGADEATIDLALGDANGMRLQAHLTIAAGKRELVVKDADGRKQASPQKILDALYSAVAFHPLAFAEDEPAKQAATLRKLVGLDFAELDRERQRLYDQRTEVGRELKNASERMTSIPLDVLHAPSEEVNIGALMAQKTRAASQNQLRRDKLAELTRLADRRRELREELERIEARIAEMMPYVPDDVDTSQLDIDLVNAEATNRKVRAKQEREELSERCREREKEHSRLTKAIDAIDAKKAQAMAAAPWPVPGLGFSEKGDGVLFGGLPFEQASSAEKLRVSLAIGAALNPTLRVMTDRNGSLLDDRSMAIVRQFATEHDMQLWLERVGGRDPGAIIIEDGQVASLDDRA
jgi:DNA repair exonuclease SbcCD ATPase subunit